MPPSVKRPARRKSPRSAKAAAKRTRQAALQPPSRLPPLRPEQFSDAQRALVDAISSGPRGAYVPQGPFAVFLQAPAYGQLAQALGAHCRYHTGLPPRLSEFAILVTARHWRAQFEWYAHAPIAAAAGVSKRTMADLRAGRRPDKAPADERALYDFIRELYDGRRVGDRTYGRLRKYLGETGMIELTGILGYYALVAMTINIFQMPVPEAEDLPFPAKRTDATRRNCR